MREDRMRKVSDVIKPAFPNAEYAKAEDLMDEPLLFKGYSLNKSDKGGFFTVLVQHDKKDKCFSCGGKVVMNKLQRIADIDKVKPNENGITMFKEVFQGKLIQVESGSGMTYYDIVDVDLTE